MDASQPKSVELKRLLITLRKMDSIHVHLGLGKEYDILVGIITHFPGSLSLDEVQTKLLLHDQPLLLKVFLHIHIMCQVHNLLKVVVAKEVLLILKAEVVVVELKILLVVVIPNMPLHPTLFRALVSLHNHCQVLVALPLVHIIHNQLVHLYHPWEF
uniref:Uncharacterized protein n=1 Tax=Solanum lycopersicum TaxID=4081 RepID=K4C4K2_SOLLC